MCLSAPSVPNVPPPPEPAKDAADMMTAAAEDQRKKAALLAGLSGTIKTGGAGITQPATTATKTLLGQ